MSIAANANALTTLAMAKDYLKIPSSNTAQDDIVQFFINAASDYLEEECDRKFTNQSLTEYHHGRRNNMLLLREWPVTGITSLAIDNTGQFTDPQTVVSSTEYAIADDKQSLVLFNRVFPNGYNNIKVVYTGGYSTIPSDLQNACLWLVFWYYRMRENQDIGRTQKSKGDESIQILQAAPQDVKDCILRRKRTECPFSDALSFNT